MADCGKGKIIQAIRKFPLVTTRLGSGKSHFADGSIISCCMQVPVNRNAPLKILTSSTDSGELRKICPIFPNPGSGRYPRHQSQKSDLTSPNTMASAKAAGTTTGAVVIPCTVSIGSPDEDEQSSRGKSHET